jgi:amino acid transporter
MSEDTNADEEMSFGEKLLGMQGFSAARAMRYRAELEKLLVHRITRLERWSVGIFAVYVGAAFVSLGIALATSSSIGALFEGTADARNILSATSVITGLVLGGWLIRIVIQGGYRRRLGDFMGIFITLLLCGGWGFALVCIAWGSTDEVNREKLLLASGAFFVLMAASMVVALLQRLHRQTQEKLLRIEYHLAELMERNTEAGRERPT